MDVFSYLFLVVKIFIFVAHSWASRMLNRTRSRVTADPTIRVSDLMVPLEKYMVHAGERNLLPLAKAPPGVGWKSAPDLQWLAKHAKLWQEYLMIAPNSMVPPKKHRLAIEKLDQQQKCKYSKQSMADFSDAVDTQVRVGLKQLRDMKQDAHTKERAFRKVDQSVQDTINKLLSYITKVDKLAVAEDEDSQNQTPSRERLAIMDAPRQSDTTQKGPLAPVTEDPQKKGLSLSPSKLFQKILAQKDSDEEIDIVYTKDQKKPKQENTKKDKLKSASSKVAHKEDTSPPKKVSAFLSPMALEKEEEKMIEEAMGEGPLENMRAKKNSKKKKEKKTPAESKPAASKNKAKKKAAPKKKTAATKSSTSKTEEKTDVTEPKVPSKTKVKRPSAAIEELQPPDHAEPVLSEKIFEGMFDMTDGRSKVRHRLESRAHGKAMQEFKNLPGYKPERDRSASLAWAKKARVAFAIEFEKRWPKDQEAPNQHVPAQDAKDSQDQGSPHGNDDDEDSDPNNVD